MGFLNFFITIYISVVLMKQLEASHRIADTEAQLLDLKLSKKLF